VDDETRILDGIRRMMYADRKSWEMTFAQGGEAAIKAFEDGSFDVVVSDMRMPGMDGAALLRRIRDLSPSTVRIILSGFTEAEAAIRAVPVAHRFLAKPCDAPSLRAALECSCALQDILNSGEIRKVVTAIGDLPALSSTYLALNQAINDPDVSIDKVAGIIERDVSMSAKVLQLTNSAFFGLARTVTSVSQAVSYLGTNTVKNLVLVAHAFSEFVPNSRIPASTWQHLQDHGRRASGIASKLPISKAIRDATTVAALLHDIGQLVLACKMPEQFLAIQSLMRERQCPGYIAEQEVLGTSHAEIGAYLLALWGLPHIIMEPIAHHHRPTRIPHEGFDITVAIYIADRLADQPPEAATNPAAIQLTDEDHKNLETLGLTAQFPTFLQFIAQLDPEPATSSPPQAAKAP
jgi:HD-like signal output (HDOD) protein